VSLCTNWIVQCSAKILLNRQSQQKPQLKKHHPCSECRTVRCLLSLDQKGQGYQLESAPTSPRLAVKNFPHELLRCAIKKILRLCRKRAQVSHRSVSCLSEERGDFSSGATVSFPDRKPPRTVHMIVVPATAIPQVLPDLQICQKDICLTAKQEGRYSARPHSWRRQTASGNGEAGQG
jgi:hypothetical protein